jgi:hypothetical protein
MNADHPRSRLRNALFFVQRETPSGNPLTDYQAGPKNNGKGQKPVNI